MLFFRNIIFFKKNFRSKKPDNQFVLAKIQSLLLFYLSKYSYFNLKNNYICVAFCYQEKYQLLKNIKFKIIVK